MSDPGDSGPLSSTEPAGITATTGSPLVRSTVPSALKTRPSG